MADLNFSAAASYRISGAFGLLSSARLAVVAEEAGTPVLHEMRRLVSSMGGLRGQVSPGDLPAVQRFVDDVPVLDDPVSPIYFSCTAAMIAADSMMERSDSPERLAWRLSSNAMNAWDSCDRILRRTPKVANRLYEEMGATLREKEEDMQRDVLRRLANAPDVGEVYSAMLRTVEADQAYMKPIAITLSRNAGW
ncbi:hypothetical protein ACIRNI_01200 [Streptomyces sp. NPDC093546]|uniref:hypothetical protein n=1 Tax=Streptomyces sp. NPDC093546 TaxID=3366040 RepID=UPI003817256D